MVPSNQKLTQYLHEAAIAEVTDDYLRDGYDVSNRIRVGDVEVDLVARKGNSRIYFEFKVGKSKNRLDTILQVKRQAEKDGAEFRLVYVTPPTKVAVDIVDIESKFETYLGDEMPSEVEALSTHTSLNEVTDVETESVTISPDKILVRGTFLLNVSFQYGSSSDQRDGNGLTSEDTFVTKFEAEFNGDLDLISLDVYVDTSSWDE